MSFFSNEPRNTLLSTLILDISSHSIGVALVSKPKEGLPEIFYAHREYVSYEKKPTAKQIQSKILLLIKDIFENHLIPTIAGFRTKEIAYKINHVYVMHSLAWSFSTTRHIEVTFEKEVVVTEEMLCKLALENANADKDATANMKLISRFMSDVRLNGYKIKNPWGKKTKKLFTTSSETYIDQTMIKLVEEEIWKRTHSIIEHTPESYNILETLRNDLKEDDFKSIVHLGGETTEVILIVNKQCRSTISIPYGVNSLCREVGIEEESDHHIAYAHITGALSKKRSFKKSERAAYDAASLEWKGKIWKAIHDLVEGGSMPATLYIVSLPHHEPIAKEVCNENSYKEFSQLNNAEVIMYNSMDLKGFYNVRSGVSYDMPLFFAFNGFRASSSKQLDVK